MHRKSGMLFVFAIVTMAVCRGRARGRAPWQAANVPAGLLTAYLVMHRADHGDDLLLQGGAGWISARMLMALAVALTVLTFGFQAIANGGTRNRVPAFPFFMFGIVGLLASIGDVRMIRSGGLRGAPRLARHLWRMCFALFIAAASFFLVIERAQSA